MVGREVMTVMKVGVFACARDFEVLDCGSVLRGAVSLTLSSLSRILLSSKLRHAKSQCLSAKEKLLRHGLYQAWGSKRRVVFVSLSLKG